MPSGERGYADDMDVVLHRLARDLLRRREKGSDIDVEAQVGESRSDNFLPAIVAVLTDLGDENARPPPVVLQEGFRHTQHARDRRLIHASLPSIDADD